MKKKRRLYLRSITQKKNHEGAVSGGSTQYLPLSRHKKVPLRGGQNLRGEKENDGKTNFTTIILYDAVNAVKVSRQKSASQGEEQP
jgi:hypothetical protein